MRKIVFLFLTLGLSSCYLFKENGIDYKIINNSNHSISNIVLKTSENTDSLVIELLKPEESKSGFLKMVNAKRDGGYVLEYTMENGDMFETGGGYYTNGGSLDSWIRFEINQDTTLVSLGQYP